MAESTPEAVALQQQISDIREELKAKALNMVQVVMPTKVIQLSDLYKVQFIWVVTPFLRGW